MNHSSNSRPCYFENENRTGCLIHYIRDDSAMPVGSAGVQAFNTVVQFVRSASFALNFFIYFAFSNSFRQATLRRFVFLKVKLWEFLTNCQIFRFFPEISSE